MDTTYTKNTHISSMLKILREYAYLDLRTAENLQESLKHAIRYEKAGHGIDTTFLKGALEARQDSIFNLLDYVEKVYKLRRLNVDIKYPFTPVRLELDHINELIKKYEGLVNE